MIFEVSVPLHGDKAKETLVVVDSIVQEKNSTFHTDATLITKIVTRYHTMAKLEDVKLRRSYQFDIKSLLGTVLFKSKGLRQSESQRAGLRLRTISDILVSELKRKFSPEALSIHQRTLELYDRVQRQQSSDTAKINTLHELGGFCICKAMARKQYEFCAKASVTVTKAGGNIVSALSFRSNILMGTRFLRSLLRSKASWGKGRPWRSTTEDTATGARPARSASKFPSHAGGRKTHLASGKPGSGPVAVRPSSRSSSAS